MTIRPGGSTAALSTMGRLLAPSDAGVYAICDADGNYLYFGESHDIRRRLNEHMSDRDDCIHMYGPSRYAYELHPIEERRVARRKQLAIAYPTPCNQRHG